LTAAFRCYILIVVTVDSQTREEHSTMTNENATAQHTAEPPVTCEFYIVFDGPPSHASGRFVEVEDEQGHSLKVGEWEEREDGFWTLGPFVEANVHEELLKALEWALPYAEEHAERTSQCCGAPQHSEVEGMCAKCREWTGFDNPDLEYARAAIAAARPQATGEGGAQ
jgi:hypothetical protein